MQVTASQQHARRWGAGTAAIVRLLIASARPRSGVEIARIVGVTQPRASQVLSRLAKLGGAELTKAGWVGSINSLLDLYTERTHPTLSTVESYWYGIASLAEQVHNVVSLSSDITVSADIAPDLLVPWRHPTVAVIYTRTQLDLGMARLVPAEGRADATIIVRTLDDQRLPIAFDLWPTEQEGVPIADPTQQYADLFDLGGADRQEAAQRLRDAIIARTIPGIA